VNENETDLAAVAVNTEVYDTTQETYRATAAGKQKTQRGNGEKALEFLKGRNRNLRVISYSTLKNSAPYPSSRSAGDVDAIHTLAMTKSKTIAIRSSSVRVIRMAPLEKGAI
jgi:hypothetical protein